jgi:hypothetical protein
MILHGLLQGQLYLTVWNYLKGRIWSVFKNRVVRRIFGAKRKGGYNCIMSFCTFQHMLLG